MALVGLLMLIGPAAIFLATFPLSGRLRPGLRKTYRILGAVVVFVGTGISYYFAAYTGDQGGITAYFFQLLVITAYLTLSAAVIVTHYLQRSRKS